MIVLSFNFVVVLVHLVVLLFLVFLLLFCCYCCLFSFGFYIALAMFSTQNFQSDFEEV